MKKNEGQKCRISERKRKAEKSRDQERDQGRLWLKRERERGREREFPACTVCCVGGWSCLEPLVL